MHFGLEGYIPYLLYFGGIAVFFISLREPLVGLFVFTLMLPLQTIRSRVLFLPAGNKFVDILLLGAVIGLVLRHGLVAFKTPMGGLFVFVSIFYYVSLVQGTFYLNRPLPFTFDDMRLSNWKNYSEMFLYCIVTASTIRNKKQAQWLLVVIAVSVLLVNKSFHDTMGDRDLSHFSYDVRYAGTLGYAGENGTAAFETMMFAFFLAIAAYAKRLPLKLGILALVSTSIYCILFSFSREAYLGSFVALILLGILKERKLLVVALVLLVAWETILPKSVQERIVMTTTNTTEGHELDSSSQERVEIWQDGLTIFSSAPIFGIGFDTYEFLDRVGPYHDTHNYYLKVLIETGVTGLLLYLWLFGSMCRLGYLLFRRAEDPFWAAIGLAFLCLMAGLAVVNFFGDRWTYQQLDGYVWILLGCVIRGIIVTEEDREAERDREGILDSLDVAGVLSPV